MFNSMYDLIQGRREADIFSQGNVDNRPRTLSEAIKEVLKIDYNGKTGSNIVGVGSETGIERRRGSTGDVERGGRGTEGERAADGKGRAKGDAGEEGVAEKRKALHPSSVESKDNQGNPINADGTLRLEKVKSVDDLTDEDFSKPYRNVELPELPKNVDDAIGANGKPVVIKKNIFEKNGKSHKDLSASQSREILTEALYHPNLYGQNQKTSRPYNWILIHNAEKHSSVILEVSHNKDNVEIVNWHYLDDVTLKQKERQAVKEGGLILTLESAAGNTHNNLSSGGKVTAKASKKQGKGKKKVEPGQQVDYYSAFAEQYGLDAEEAKKETVANAPAKAKEVKGLSNKLKDRYPTSLYLLGRDISDMEEMVANGEVSPKRVERVRSEIKRLKGLLADYERLATPEERSWRHMKAEHPDEIVVVDRGNGLLVVCQEDVKSTNKAIGQKLDAPVTENLIVTTNEEQGMPFTTMRVTLADLQRLSDKGIKYVVLDKIGNQAKEEREKQGKGKKKVEPEQQVDYYSAFAEQYGLDAEEAKKETVGNSFDDFVRDSGGEVIPNGVTRSNVINFAERVLEKYPSHTESYDTYNAKRTDVEIRAHKLFKSESHWFTAKNGNFIAVNDTQAKACYELVAHKDAQGHLKSVSVIKYHSFDNALTDEEVVAITDAMKANATVAPTVEINDANWKESVETPVGSVKMGENQKAKLFAKGREQQYGMLLETLSNPDVVLEEKDKEQNMFHERPSSYLFVKTFQKEDGSKYVHFESVTVSQEGMEVSISSHIIRENQLKNKLKSDRLLYKATALDAPANTSAEQPIVGGSLSSDGKDTEKGSSGQEDGEKNVLSDLEREFQKALEHEEDVEQKWEDKIQDYVAEHYPTQATVSAATTSAKGVQEREAMKSDHVLRAMREKADAEYKEARDATFAAQKKMETAKEKMEAREHKADVVENPSHGEEVLRDAVIDKLRESGIEVLGAEGQKVLDMANGKDVRLEAKRKRALETASLGANPRSLTAISSADGVKVLKNLDNLVKNLENSPTQPKTFIGEMAEALGIDMKDKSSKYATFECKNGNIVTIRVSDHNATASNLDTNGQSDAISVVITNKDNKGVVNDGDAHIVEFYYNAIKLRKAEGKPLADIANSIKQALYSGEFKDTTGLAEKQEVNANYVREQRVYHGSGADFDHFDHSHMGEGEGAQAYGWGTYVTEVEGIGRKYAEQNRKDAPEFVYNGRYMDFSRLYAELSEIAGADNYSIVSHYLWEWSKNGAKRAKEYLTNEIRGRKGLRNYSSNPSTYDEKIAGLEALLKVKGIRKNTKTNKTNLYTVEIPDDTGENYLDYNRKIAKIPSQKNEAICEQLRKALPSKASRIRLNPNATGADLYKDISTELNSDKKASQLLSRAGFVGIKYPAGYLSGGRKDGAKNYVIFDEKDAKITDHVRFFKTKNGEAYGFTVGGKIYIDPRIANAETPIHEYAHLWASALRSGNPKEWENVVGLMKGTPVWDEVKKRYPELETDDEIADEVIATYSGRRGAERLRREAAKIAGSMDELDAVKALSALQRVKEALKRFWKGVCDFLHIHFTSAEEVADRVMKDLLDGVDPRKFMKGKDGRPRFQFIGEKGAERADHAEEVNTRLDNLAVAREMEEAKKEAKAIKMATGWERGADGKWRYEMPDAKIKDTIDVGGGNIVKRYEEGMLWNDGKLEDAVDAPKLFEAYPQLKNIKIHTDAVMNYMPSNGYYNPQTNTITIHAADLKYLNSILNHEIQHAIQNIEGFAQGGNSETVRSRIQKIIDEEKDASEYAKSNLKQYAALHMLASRLKASKQFAKSDQQFFKDKAREYYWDAMNELDNNERSTLINEYPDDKNAQEIAESGYHVDEAIKELKRIADEYKDEIPKGNMDAFEKVNKLTSALENKSNDELYQDLAGEVEARNVQKRLGMTDEERRNSLAEETEDVSRGDQIVMNNGGTSYSIVKDPETIKKLDKEDTVKVYRAMQVGEDGKLYPPMAAKVKGKFVQPIELGKWEQADERPELADDKGMFTLNKGNGKSLKAAYNPYLHTSRTPLNDQFSEAQNRPNIVTVEVEVPKSELTSGYKADKAKDAVGEVEWKAGIIQGQLTGKRKVILSRWDKPVRIVPDSEVADVIVNDMFKGKNITMPSNVVTPSLRKELEKRGVPFVETDNRGRIVGGENDGVHYSKVYGKKANVEHRFGETGAEEFHSIIDQMFDDPNFDKSQHNRERYDLCKTPTWMQGIGIKGENFSLSFKNIKEHRGKDSDHDLTKEEWHELPNALKNPFAITRYQGAEDRFRLYVNINHDGKPVAVGVDVKRVNQGKNKPQLDVNSIKTVFAHHGEIGGSEVLVTYDKEITPEQQELLRGLNFHEYPTIQELSDAKISEKSDSSKVSDENVADDGIKLSLGDGGSREREQMDEAKMVEMVERVKATGESLGGAEVHVYTSFVDVPEEYKKEVKKGARGWYDPETHTVHVYLPNCASGDEAQRTVFHEKIGHEGIEVLFGGEEGVKDFAKFVFSSCGKEIREKVMEIADQYDPEWKHPDRTNVGTQEYIAKLAENGPQTAEEFSLWRKIKHYLIKAMKKLGLTIRGLMNDKDLRYYLLRAQQSLHVWDKMPEAKKRAMAEQASETEMKESLSNRPRKRKNETTAQYIERLRQWEKWKIALDKASVANDPLPEEETYHDKWDKQYRTDMEAWRKANDIAEGAEGPSEAPKRAEGESPQEYALRVADHEREMDLWQGAPDYFSYLKKAQEDYRQAYEAWKERYDIDEMENVDLQLYGGETPTEGPADEDAYQEQEDQYQLLIILICTLLPL